MSTPDKPVVLAGFMATGKSTVGKILAHNLGWRFADLDKAIEQAEGKPVARIFADSGEAHFRELESLALRQVLAIDGAADARRVVLAVGGGAILNKTNRDLMLEHARVFCLRAPAGEILKRAGDVSTRPLLAGGAPEQRIEQLLRERAPAYARLPFHIETGGLGAVEVAKAIEGVLRRNQWHVRLSVPISADEPTARHGYDIHVGHENLDDFGLLLAGRQLTSPVAIVTDSNVSARYARQVAETVQRAGLKAFVCEMRAGEAFKNLKTVEQLYAEFARRNLERGGAVVALGGGVVGDTAGYAAATWLRGVPVFQVPTSLLAMADSSIGGKVGVDAPFGKNMIGAFKQPEAVLIDLATLQSLPQDELACGWAEIIKAGLISGRMGGMDNDIRASWRNPADAAPSLLSAIALKRDVVQEDPFERGKRAWLNLGHTFGHGIEFWSEFSIKHGQAVALGMVCALNLSIKMGLCPPDLHGQTLRLLRLAKLPTHLNDLQLTPRKRFDVDAIWTLMQQDKKRSAGRVRLVLIRAPGDVMLPSEYDDADARAALASIAT